MDRNSFPGGQHIAANSCIQSDMQPFRTSIATLVAAAALLTTGCHPASAPTPENFTKGISKYLAEHQDCLYKASLRFPYSTSDKSEIKQLDTLVDSRLLARTTEAAIKVNRYTITDFGQKSAPRFCYGFRHVTGIQSSTPPTKGASGFNESKVTYTYTLQDTPVWAKTPAVQAAYPDAAKQLSGQQTDTITMAQTGVGWQVPD